MMKKRSSDFDRRSGIDRRRSHDLDYFFSGGTERRLAKERRSDIERRSDWLKIDKFTSIFMPGANEINMLPAA